LFGRRIRGRILSPRGNPTALQAKRMAEAVVSKLWAYRFGKGALPYWHRMKEGANGKRPWGGPLLSPKKRTRNCLLKGSGKEKLAREVWRRTPEGTKQAAESIKKNLPIAEEKPEGLIPSAGRPRLLK